MNTKTMTKIDDLHAMKQKIDRFKKAFVPYGAARLVEAELEKIHHLGHLGSHGESANCLLITGESGSGKTASLRAHEQRYPVVHEPFRDRRPVLYVDTPARCSIKSLAEVIAVKLGIPKPSGSVATLTERIAHHLKHQGVELLIIDEFHHLVDRKSQAVAFDVADWVKTLLNEGLVPIVLAGLPSAKKVLEYNEQLQRRSIGHIALQPFNWDADRAEFLSVLKALETVLPVPCDLGDEATAFRIHSFSTGRIGYITQLLEVASLIALDEKAGVIDHSILARAIERLLGSSEAVFNPFRVSPVQALAPANASIPDHSRVTRLRGSTKKASFDQFIAGNNLGYGNAGTAPA